MEAIPYRESEVTYKKIYNYILANLPDFSVNIDSVKKLDDFNSKDDKDINKVILFSKKAKTPAIFKALTSEFKNKLRFGFISQEREDLVSKYGIKSFPTIIVLKSYDPLTKEVLGEVE